VHLSKIKGARPTRTGSFVNPITTPSDLRAAFAKVHQERAHIKEVEHAITVVIRKRLQELTDTNEFLALYTAGDPRADLAAHYGTFNNNDLVEFLSQMSAGCNLNESLMSDNSIRSRRALQLVKGTPFLLCSY